MVVAILHRSKDGRSGYWGAFAGIVQRSDLTLRVTASETDIAHLVHSVGRAGVLHFQKARTRPVGYADIIVDKNVDKMFDGSVMAWEAHKNGRVDVRQGRGVKGEARIQGAAAREGVAVDVVARRIEAQIPMRRLGEPAEFGALAAFLASDRASYITAQSIAIDGGWIRSLL